MQNICYDFSHHITQIMSELEIKENAWIIWQLLAVFDEIFSLGIFNSNSIMLFTVKGRLTK